MIWGPQQQLALDAARRWLDAPAGRGPQCWHLRGGAGTGKTTLAQALNAHVGGGALACAYTGKAASVLSRKGLPGATTIHRLIYRPAGDDTSHIDDLREEAERLEAVPDPGQGLLDRLSAVRRALEEAERRGGQPRFTLKGYEECEVTSAPLVILDEASMCDERTAKDLLSFGTRVLVIGDPGQLPPVKGTGWFMESPPDFVLTEVHRQARGNPIIALATSIREGRPLSKGEWRTEQGCVRVVSRVGPEEALAVDQILVGTNRLRRTVNARHRQLKGNLERGPFPFAGERLMCLRNDHAEGLLNGTVWWATQDAEWFPEDESLALHLEPEEGGPERRLFVDSTVFLQGEEAAPRWGPQPFTFSYACTVHKSQGSSWGSVLGFADDWKSRESYRQWLYTLATRAERDLTLVTG